MDFRRPGEHPTEDMQRHYDGTNGNMPPVQPLQQQTIVNPKSNKGLKFLVWLLSILVVGAAGYGTYAYLTQHDLQTQLDSANSQVRSLTVDKALLESKAGSTDKKTITTTTSEEKITLAAGNYACNIDQFGCDKVSKTITKLQKYVAPGPGFAIVKVTNTPSGATTNLYLRTVDDTNWVVIYEGASAPSQDVVKRYAIPTDFTRLP